MYPNEETIFEAALQYRDPAERRAYVAKVCGMNAKLQTSVETLLQAHDSQSLLDEPVLDSDPHGGTPPLLEGPGTVIGRYQLLEKIGEGGMAVVYMAEQTEPLRRKVALKIIKLGMDTRQVIARFEAERQALALMDHPSIAKVFDAGATETGRPYFVMELVSGVSITEYCDRNRVSTKDRLGLFLQVCHAVQHAHTKGIIHRDLKPSNVMVTMHDGKPMPKVIDFGIAKATNQKLTEKTLFTRYAHIIGTPAYMSPEQAELSDLDIDTRSDIYSLGVLLYELLTGTTPFSEEELRKAGYLEMQRVIREQEPVKPSTRIRTALRSMDVGPQSRKNTFGVPLPPMESQGHLGPVCTGETPVVLMGRMPMLREVRGDLDWIVMKTLEKDRARRYETASGLAEDIRRHLEHEPVLARGPSIGYRVERFLRRHRSQVASALAIAVVAVAAGVLLSLWNRDRRQVVEAEGFKHRGILSQAREQYAKADRQAALETIRPILTSRHAGAEARLLQATILADNRQSKEAMAVLGDLLGERPEIAGTAHALLARILWESESLDAEKLQQIGEHRRQAEALLFGVPPSGGKDQSDPRKRGTPNAEAYFLRAMTAVTVREQLVALNEALALDPDHYESLRLRAFTHYASRKYERMRDDALGMTYLRRGDPLGYFLLAVALRELGRYEDAITEYDRALVRMGRGGPQYVDLSTQRCETLLRMGRYENLIAAAQEMLTLWPHKPIFRYHLFCALTALGDYDGATAVFQEIVRFAPTARNEFSVWVTKYVFDTLEARQSWHPPDRQPLGAAFLPMAEAEEAYRNLSSKARRITTNGFSGRWSPDGKKLAFSLGVYGYSGVALYDPATRETELLIVPGKHPRWSPDGKYIAFVRDCQALRLEALTTTEPRDQTRWATDEEVWVMNADGTEPRRLARGGWPSWDQDAAHIYFQSRLDNIFCSISMEDLVAEPKKIASCLNLYPSLSPDGRRLAYVDGPSLKVVEVASQVLVAEWPAPPNTAGGPAWSPAGDELCLGGNGVWIYRFDRSEPTRILGGPITTVSWTPDGTKLVFHLGQPSYEIWAADLAPNASALEALGVGRTMDEHLQEIMGLYTRRIEADPLDAYAYSNRAQYYGYAHDGTKADADTRRWSAILNHGLSSNFRPDGPWTLVRAIEGPASHKLVIFLERQEDGKYVLRIALGQKGRCEMKAFKIPTVVASWLGLCLLAGLDPAPVQANFTFGTPTNLGAGINSSTFDSPDTLSADGLDLYISTGAVAEIRVAHRATVDSEWGPLVKLELQGNSPMGDSQPSLSADGLTLYFNSDRAGGSGSFDLWITTRATTQDNWGTPVNLGATVNSASWDWASKISADDLELYFVSNRPGGFGSHDLYVTTRATKEAPWGPPVNLGVTINSSSWEDFPYLSADGLSLFFNSNRPGGYGSGDIYMARRPTRTAPWGSPVNLGPAVNSPYSDGCPLFSLDGTMFYFGSRRPGGYGNSDIWQIPVIRIVDFNSDGKIDAKDMALFVANWGQDKPLCDIGPFPWGDGVVDEQDLRVLMESLMTPGPKASDIPCDVALSWISPSFVQTCDVYLGTSLEAVDTASRTNPQGVLVSQDQTASMYDPPGLLELSTTYYWRVDFVIADPAPAIYKGPVLQFTTAGLMYPLQNVTATASSASPGSGPERTVDGSGLDKNDGHSIDQKNMWWSMGTAPNWIEYEFDKVRNLHEMWVWNFNTVLEPFMGFGARTVKIEYSADGTAWTALADVPEFKRAPGKTGYAADTKVSFGGAPAKFVKLTIEKNWGGAAPQTGLSEVRFFALQNTAAAQP